MRPFVPALLAALALTACQKEQPAPPIELKAAPTPEHPQKHFGGLPDRLQAEAESRPDGTIAAEKVLADLEAKGIKVLSRGQHLAAPYGAEYCLGAKLEADLSLSLCEYRDESAATAGRESDARAFKDIHGRQVFVNRKTTLALLQSPQSERGAATEQAVLAVFNSEK